MPKYLMLSESEINVPEAGTPKHLDNDPLKPHEQRALNFLINEYLLAHEYKLTSITFADENENQVSSKHFSHVLPWVT